MQKDWDDKEIREIVDRYTDWIADEIGEGHGVTVIAVPRKGFTNGGLCTTEDDLRMPMCALTIAMEKPELAKSSRRRH
jgi:hypothetical protein